MNNLLGEIFPELVELRITPRANQAQRRKIKESLLKDGVKLLKDGVKAFLLGCFVLGLFYLVGKDFCSVSGVDPSTIVDILAIPVMLVTGCIVLIIGLGILAIIAGITKLIAGLLITS